MDSASYAGQEMESVRQIRRRYHFSGDPVISYTMRPIPDEKDPEHLHVFEKSGLIKVIPPGYYGFYKENRQLIRAEYFRLKEQPTRDSRSEIWLLKMQVRYKDMTSDAAYKWGYTGTLENGDRFAGILFTLVRRPFRKCGLAHLLKMKEVAVLRDLGCRFIQTYHEIRTPHFVPSIIPNLRSGFAFCTDILHREEIYRHDCGFVHLRKHFSCDPQKTRVVFANGPGFVSPDQNGLITEYMMGKRRFYNSCDIRILPLSSRT